MLDVPRKTPASVVSIDSVQRPVKPQGPPPRTPASQKRFFGNQHTQRKWYPRFMSGVSLWRISREDRVPPSDIEESFRMSAFRLQTALLEAERRAAEAELALSLLLKRAA